MPHFSGTVINRTMVEGEPISDPLPAKMPAPEGLEQTQRMLPMRYKIKEDEKGPLLYCVEEPHITASVARDFCISTSAARKYPNGSVFLDGAAQGEPFLDTQKQIYNLDHHEGCIRPFTLATCEQALVLIRKGLDLQAGQWQLYANEPDLDTVLAIWLFFNYRHINAENPEIRNRMIPLVRLQGLIDAHGLEQRDLSGFEEERAEELLATINHLRQLEVEMKKAGSWKKSDPLEYTMTALSTIDELVYTARHFDDIPQVEELERAFICQDRIALVFRSELGIYEAEQQLKAHHGSRLGLLILQKDQSTYTLRQIDPFLPTNLQRVYARLNTLDPVVHGEKRWGGSAEIGGSPRGEGSQLSSKEILDICQWVYQPPSIQERLTILAKGLALVVTALALPLLALWLLVSSFHLPGFLTQAQPLAHYGLALTITMISGIFLFLGEKRYPRQFHLAPPKSPGWLVFLPLCLIGGCLGGVWAPLASLAGVEGAGGLGLLPLPIVAALSCELLFRGALFSLLLGKFPVMRHAGPVFISLPNLFSALISTLAMALLFLPPTRLFTSWDSQWVFSMWLGLCFINGLVMGFARERFASPIAPMALHPIAAGTAFLVTPLLFG